MKSCFLVRLPGKTTIEGGIAGDSEYEIMSLEDDFDHTKLKREGKSFETAFIFGGFSLFPRIYCIPAHEPVSPGTMFDDIVNRNVEAYFQNHQPSEGTTAMADHIMYVERIKRLLTDVEEHTGLPSKIVAARVKNIHTGLTPSEIFRRLCDRYPDAFVFIFSSARFGTWMGASPETVFYADKTTYRSQSLAGTRKASGAISDDTWGEKEIAEHKIVTDFLCNAYKVNGYNPVVSSAETVKSGPVEHISQWVEATPYSDNAYDAINMLRLLSPTPALSGYPRNLAMDVIERNEKSRRLLYGGFVGLYNRLQNVIQAFANLRSGRYNNVEGDILLYAGGGITRDSDPEAEWEETQNKLSTLESVMKCRY